MEQFEEALAKWEARVGEIDWEALSTDRSDRLETILVQVALDYGVMSRMRFVGEDELREVIGAGKPRRGRRKKR